MKGVINSYHVTRFKLIKSVVIACNSGQTQTRVVNQSSGSCSKCGAYYRESHMDNNKITYLSYSSGFEDTDEYTYIQKTDLE